jgi:hypothetical protein
MHESSLCILKLWNPSYCDRRNILLCPLLTMWEIATVSCNISHLPFISAKIFRKYEMIRYLNEEKGHCFREREDANGHGDGTQSLPPAWSAGEWIPNTLWFQATKVFWKCLKSCWHWLQCENCADMIVKVCVELRAFALQTCKHVLLSIGLSFNLGNSTSSISLVRFFDIYRATEFSVFS